MKINQNYDVNIEKFNLVLAVITQFVFDEVLRATVNGA